jgi:L,D-transpeptidase ErfK/SrfK
MPPPARSATRLRALAKLAGAAACLFATFAAQATTYPLPPPGEDVVGAEQETSARYEDTLLDIARRYDLGFVDITNANAGVDTWIPGEGTRVALPTRYILPNVPRDGIVINIAEMRLYYFPREPVNGRAVVITHPISIGREDWATPLGLTKVVKKDKDPAWYPPETIRAEHAANGDPLPKMVPPGPQNPLGLYALRLGLSGYLIHGTDKPFGIGMQVTHGCMRLYPEDIETMFAQVPVGTPVNIINQPVKTGWHDGMLYIETHPPFEGQPPLDPGHLVETLVMALRDQPDYAIDWRAAEDLAMEARGVPVQVPARPGSRRVQPVQPVVRAPEAVTPAPAPARKRESQESGLPYESEMPF